MLEIMINLEILSLEIFPRVGENRIGWMTVDVRGMSDRQEINTTSFLYKERAGCRKAHFNMHIGSRKTVVIVGTKHTYIYIFFFSLGSSIKSYEYKASVLKSTNYGVQQEDFPTFK